MGKIRSTIDSEVLAITSTLSTTHYQVTTRLAAWKTALRKRVRRPVRIRARVESLQRELYRLISTPYE